jgi:hypothetical protein
LLPASSGDPSETLVGGNLDACPLFATRRKKRRRTAPAQKFVRSNMALELLRKPRLLHDAVVCRDFLNRSESASAHVWREIAIRPREFERWIARGNSIRTGCWCAYVVIDQIPDDSGKLGHQLLDGLGPGDQGKIVTQRDQTLASLSHSAEILTTPSMA